MFVGDIINGYLYHLKLNPQRTDLDLSLIRWQIAQMWFSRLYLESGITDIKVGPGGNDRYLYVLTFSKAEGTIFRIIPKD
ncbi:MAG: hypothetical protein WBP64_15610, partial [Nitrososphaeraceae archaeon]